MTSKSSPKSSCRDTDSRYSIYLLYYWYLLYYCKTEDDLVKVLSAVTVARYSIYLLYYWY